ncbi:hypothetical protein CVU83_01175 [Candidatus Falkowbacteria bacterium HGW-Falkowbacteria-2]|uniref:Uncharacterized protein n=1 Tax=Candidatus Falkowbacteria bacterium HGW-Falkowbacteria-2 TaxID=2013769 RepID=A0A2N2E251_9BACT|nr:MAG: hypothetical protein CVU83_01175 [Candidatus Falkowbacteria bacterium HGW-Falkowbacteria-2]
MKNYLINYAAWIGLFLVGFAIVAVYFFMTRFFPGTLNEIATLISLLVIVTIARKKFSYYIEKIDYFGRKLDFYPTSVLDFFLITAVYFTFTVFANDHGSNHQLPTYAWITILTILVIFPLFFKKNQPWETSVFITTTFYFLLAMFKNYDSQFIWMIAVPYLIVMELMNDLVNGEGMFHANRASRSIWITVLATCAVLTIIQFWAPITSFYYLVVSSITSILSLSFFGMRLIWILAAIGVFLITNTVIKQMKRKNRKKVLALQKAEEEAQRRAEADAKRKQEAAERERKEKELFDSVIEQLKSGNGSWAKVRKIYPFDISDVPPAYWHNILAISLKDLITVSTLKCQLVWDDDELRFALNQINAIALKSFNDEILKLASDALLKFENYLVSFDDTYIGKDVLNRRIATYCGDIRNLRVNSQ